MKVSIAGVGIVGVAVGFFGMSALFGSFYTIDEGERGVLLRNGKARLEVEPGLHWKFPFIEGVKTFSVQEVIESYNFPNVYSQDQQGAQLQISVNYRLLPGTLIDVYSTYGSEEGVVARVVDPRTERQTTTVFSRFDAQTAIQERGRLNAETEEAIKEAINADFISVTNVQVQSVDFSDAYEKSIEDRMLAEVEVQRFEQNLERERVQAAIRVTQAEAAAQEVRLQGLAEADAINARGEALRNNPDLVALVQAEKWNGVLPSTMIPNGTLPIIGTN